MPDKQLTIATYAAGASLAAITLVYVFAPTFFIDEQSASASASSRKKGVVGLYNPANDCFINSVLQALAGLGDLRLYLIRETHRRSLDHIDVYTEPAGTLPVKSSPTRNIKGLQQGQVTQGLKDILDALNERPLEKKTITAVGFVRVLEDAFKQRINRNQQDAQEFLQVVTERLNDEYHAGHLARQRSRAKVLNGTFAEKSLKGLPNSTSELAEIEHMEDSTQQSPTEEPEIPPVERVHSDAYNEEDGFPLEGTTESQIECLTCGFKPKPNVTTFGMLCVSVPQLSSTTLNACLDGMFKTEHIDDFKCEKCVLLHAVHYYKNLLRKLSPEDNSKSLNFESIIERLEVVIEEDPENPPNDIELPSSDSVRGKIARHVRITKFPKVLAIHLSRSIYDTSGNTSTSKNVARVSFPESLPVGGLLVRRKYKLLALTTHKGSHTSGHYETFRRQITFSAFSTPNHINPNGVYGARKSGSGEGSRAELPETNGVVEEMEEGQAESQYMTPQELGNGTPVSLPTEQTPSPSQTEISIISESSLNDSGPSLATAQHGSTSIDSHHTGSSNTTLNHKRLTKTSTSSSSTKHPNFQTSSEEAVTASTPSSIPDRFKDTDDKAETSSISSSIRRKLSKVSLSGSLQKISSRTRSARNKENGKKEQGELGVTNEHIEEVGGGRKGFVNGDRKEEKRQGKARMKRRKADERWWRISDEKVRECKTAEVLGMQKEVYLLFYELER